MLTSELLGYLAGVQKEADGWLAFCPAHEDKAKRSLHISHREGRTLLHCFRGCHVGAVVAAIKLKLSDLYDDTARPGQERAPAPAPRPAAPAETRPAPRAEARASAPSGVPRRLLATYDYANEDGLSYQVQRFEPKDFRVRRPDGKGGWTNGLGDAERVVYRLPELVEQEAAFWVEGEKDANALWALGLPATTGLGGAAAWRPAYAEQLKRLGVRELVVLPDNDDPGREYADKVVKAAMALRLQAKVVALPVGPKGDVSDWLAAGGTAAELLKLCEAVPWVSPIEPDEPRSLRRVLAEMIAEARAGGVRTVRTPWPRLNQLLDGGFNQGDLIYIGARPSVGKSAWAVQCAGAAGEDGERVLVISREMRAVALSRRLLSQRSGVPSSLIKRWRMDVDQVEAVDESVKRLERLPIYITDKVVTLDELTAMVASDPWGLVIVDYLQLVRAPADIKDRRLQVEAVSSGLKEIAMDHGVPVVCLSSLSRPMKGNQRNDPRPTMAALRESGELEHDADTIIFLHRQPLEPETEVIVSKQRDGALGIIRNTYHPEILTFTEDAI